MQIKLTGTGGADGVPSFFANSRVSEYARKHKGKNTRTRASAVVDNILRIDFGPDTFAQCCIHDVNPKDWAAILYTHSHADHYAPKELMYFFPPFVPLEEKRPAVYGNETVITGFEDAFDEAEHLQKHIIKSFETFSVQNYHITPIHAYHKLDEDSLNFIIENQSTLLYAVDTGFYEPHTWDFINGRHFDCVVVECTNGFSPAEYWGHLGCEEVIRFVSKLRALNCINNSSLIVTSHHAHDGDATHEELENFFKPHNIHVGYDGLTLNF